jgi:hypothetical protein
VIFVQEVHEVAGRDEDAFDDLLRDRWAPEVAASGDARLAWACRQAHGTGLSYRVVTYTAAPSAEAWGRLADRFAGGDLRGLATDLDRLRHGSQATLLRPVPWSPLQEIHLDAMDVTGNGPPALFMEDTAWPFRDRLDEYLEQAGDLYTGTLAEGHSMLEMVAAFQPLWGTGRWRQVVLWQRVTDPERLLGLFQTEVPPKYRAPGTWMHDALELRDQWESRLLRTLPWSPLA